MTTNKNFVIDVKYGYLLFHFENDLDDVQNFSDCLQQIVHDVARLTHNEKKITIAGFNELHNKYTEDANIVL